MTGRVNPQPVITGPLPSVLGDQFIPATTLANATALTVPPGTSLARIQAEGGNVRWRARGSSFAPTTTVGMLLANGATIDYYTADVDLALLRFITPAGGSLNVTYYG